MIQDLPWLDSIPDTAGYIRTATRGIDSAGHWPEVAEDGEQAFRLTEAEVQGGEEADLQQADLCLDLLGRVPAWSGKSAVPVNLTIQEGNAHRIQSLCGRRHRSLHITTSTGGSLFD